MGTSSHSRRRTSPAGDGRTFTGVQPDLFQRSEAALSAPPAYVDLDVEMELRGAIAQAIREARARGISRERIVDTINRLHPDLTKPVTLRQLNAWTAASKEYSEFPARYLPAFCAAVECDAPLRVLARALHLDLVDQRALAAQRLGENLIQSAALRHERRTLTSTLGG